MWSAEENLVKLLNNETRYNGLKREGPTMMTRSKRMRNQHVQFADVNGSPVEPKYGVCCLAMHFRPKFINEPDTERIRSMMMNLHVDGVLSVAWGTETYPGFCSGDFKAQIPFDVTFACQNSARVVCLDYFYLPAHYYAENYGTNWVSHKIPNLLHNPDHPNRVECVILPYDRLGEARTVEPKGSLKEQIENAKLSEDSYFDLSWKEATELHPLIKASQDVGLVASGTNKPLNQSACESYLDPDRAFAVFHKPNEKEEVRGTLRSMCIRTGPLHTQETAHNQTST